MQGDIKCRLERSEFVSRKDENKPDREYRKIPSVSENKIDVIRLKEALLDRYMYYATGKREN